MTEVSFYHLQRQSLTEALPRLLARVLASGLRAVVFCGTRERIDALDQMLWTYDPASFLPHGTEGGPEAERQPVYLTNVEENPNAATVLVVVDGGAPAYIGRFDRCLDMFDGNDDAALEAARERWRHYKEAGYTLTYWQQTEAGGWEKKFG